MLLIFHGSTEEPSNDRDLMRNTVDVDADAKPLASSRLLYPARRFEDNYDSSVFGRLRTQLVAADRSVVTAYLAASFRRRRQQYR